MKKDKIKVLTFGYGNRQNYDQFSSYLSEFDVDCVIDVRLSPKAWNRRWWGDQIKAFCESQKIPYISDSSLGNTSGTKEWVPPNKDEAEAALDSIAKDFKGKTVLLLCAELDPSRCHRTQVAERLCVLSSGQVIHLK